MNDVSSSFDRLTDTVGLFAATCRLHDPDALATSEWTVRDVLRHITYWHRYYADNLQAEAEGKTFFMPKRKYSELNEAGVESLQHLGDEELLTMLGQSHSDLGRSVLGGKVRQMTYRQGSRPYPLMKFLQVVDSHIKGHTRAIRRTAKRAVQVPD